MSVREMRYVRGIRRGLPAGVCAGVGATLTMDASMVLASRLAPAVFATEKVDVNLIGRWVGGLGRGRRRSDDITAAPMVRGEVALGLATHYLTGVALTETYLIALRRLNLRPGPVKATAFGLATAVLPLLVMFPSMGYGCCGSHSGDARRVRSIMLLGHTAFGAGIGLWSAYSPRDEAPRQLLASSRRSQDAARRARPLCGALGIEEDRREAQRQQDKRRRQ